MPRRVYAPPTQQRGPATSTGNCSSAPHTASRIGFTMGRDQKLPSALAALAPRFETPDLGSLPAGPPVAEQIGRLDRVVNFGNESRAAASGGRTP